MCKKWTNNKYISFSLQLRLCSNVGTVSPLASVNLFISYRSADLFKTCLEVRHQLYMYIVVIMSLSREILIADPPYSLATLHISAWLPTSESVDWARKF